MPITEATGSTPVLREALVECPFCGAAGYTSEGDGTWFAGCVDCYCNVGENYDRSAMSDHMFATEAEAIVAWNRRAATAGAPDVGEAARLRSEIARLRSALDAGVFLANRVADLEGSLDDSDPAEAMRDYCGHVAPALSRFQSIAVEALTAPASEVGV